MTELEEQDMQDLIGYDEIIENSMRSVIYETLKKIKKTGLPGSHYFIITFVTQFPGVSIGKDLMTKHPEEMTIALQHQFRNLVVEDELFKVSLSFDGKDQTLVIPYQSVTSFADPSMNFALKFSTNYSDMDDLDIEFDDSNQTNQNNDGLKKASQVDLSAKVISIDAFRKDKDVTNSDNT